MKEPQTFEQLYMELSEEERQIIQDHALMDVQLNNFNRMLQSASPKKQKYYEQHDLPQLLIRQRNLQGKAEAIMKKKGLIRR